MISIYFLALEHMHVSTWLIAYWWIALVSYGFIFFWFIRTRVIPRLGRIRLERDR
jgi:hypothetical protein